MAKYRYEGEEVLVLPTLGIIIKNGSTFDGPDNLNVAGLVADNGKGKSIPEPAVKPAAETEAGE